MTDRRKNRTSSNFEDLKLPEQGREAGRMKTRFPTASASKP
jgi:hypothetical protein